MAGNCALLSCLVKHGVWQSKGAHQLCWQEALLVERLHAVGEICHAPAQFAAAIRTCTFAEVKAIYV